MNINQPCAICNLRVADQEHHQFPDTKPNRKIYGKLIDAPFNKIPVCGSCNVSHANIPEWARWDERTFRVKAELGGHILPAGSKTFIQKIKRGAYE